jgi:hypothetical protein
VGLRRRSEIIKTPILFYQNIIDLDSLSRNLSVNKSRREKYSWKEAGFLCLFLTTEEYFQLLEEAAFTWCVWVGKNCTLTDDWCQAEQRVLNMISDLGVQPDGSTRFQRRTDRHVEQTRLAAMKNGIGSDDENN